MNTHPFTLENDEGLIILPSFVDDEEVSLAYSQRVIRLLNLKKMSIKHHRSV